MRTPTTIRNDPTGEGAARSLRGGLGALALAVTVAVGTLGAAGCASSGELAPLDSPGAESPRAELSVTNHNWQDMTVYVVRDDGSRPIRLGTVTSLSTASFPVRLHGAGTVRLQLDPVGSTRRYTTHQVQVHPGDEIRLEVANRLALTTIETW